jgi:predicted RNase H-like HicB family nuclease
MKTFVAVVHKDADSAFGIHFPDVPGCFSAADSLDDTMANAAEALALYFEDQAVPEPRSLEEIREEVAADIADGAILLAVPLVQSRGKMVRANISIDRGTLDAIDAAAHARGLTRSAFLADAARNEIVGLDPRARKAAAPPKRPPRKRRRHNLG